MHRPVRVILHADAPQALESRLAEQHPSVEIRTCDTYAALPSLIEDFLPDCLYSIRFAGSKDFPKAAIFSRNGPKWIHIGGSGTDHLGKWDMTAFTVTNSAGVAADMMAEFAVGCLLHFSLDIPGLQTAKSARAWTPRMLTPLRGKTVLILGLGKTGQATAKLCKCLGMQVLGTRARPAPVPHVDSVHGADAIESLLPAVDCIVVCLPLLPSTRNLLDTKSFSMVKPGAILVDLSRGGIVSEQALLGALDQGILKAAALDVFETEPLPEDSPLWAQENLLISPHSSSVFTGWELNSLDMFSTNLSRWIAGEPLNNIVDPERGY